MHTEVSIVARADGSLRFTATGGIAVRRTGPERVHLIGTAATPLGGDTIDIRVVVERDARLRVAGVAATIALPGPADTDSSTRWRIDVAEGGRLRVEPEPTIVAADARHRTHTVLDLHPDAVVAVHEAVQLGRSTERPDEAARAAWAGSMAADVGGRPVLRHRVLLGADPAVPTADGRALGSVFRYPDTRQAAVAPTAIAARLDLVGGASLTTAVAATASAARRLCNELDLPTVTVGRSGSEDASG